jgi:hypothetical protein
MPAAVDREVTGVPLLLTTAALEVAGPPQLPATLDLMRVAADRKRAAGDG